MGPLASGTLSVTLDRPKGFFESFGSGGFMDPPNRSLISNFPLINFNNDFVKVPEILAFVRTTFTGSDIGEALFIIHDEYEYYCEEKLCSKCGVYSIPSSQIKTTTFDRCCPFIVSVVRGRGETLFDKVTYLWNKYGTVLDVTFGNFYTNIVSYAMAKYILSRILYGKFKIDYILEKYNQQFLDDLLKSRFCNFVGYFTNYDSPVSGYGKFFKYDKNHC